MIRELLVKRLSGDIRIPAKSTVHAVLHRRRLVAQACKRRTGQKEHRFRKRSQRSAVCRFGGEFKRLGKINRKLGAPAWLPLSQLREPDRMHTATFEKLKAEKAALEAAGVRCVSFDLQRQARA